MKHLEKLNKAIKIHNVGKPKTHKEWVKRFNKSCEIKKLI